MRPSPTSPRVFDRISAPANFDFSHFEVFIDASAAGIFRAIDRMSPIASSATLKLFAPGAFMTTMPRAVAAGTSTLSTPVPARAMTRSLGAASIIVSRHFCRASDDQCVRILQIGRQLGGRPSLPVVDVPIWLLENLDGGSGKAVGDDNVHVVITV